MNLWLLDPVVTHLNHGSFGACPAPVLEAQQRWRTGMERNPVLFFMRTLQPAVDEAREILARFVGAKPQGLVFVPNATAGINSVLRGPGTVPVVVG
jgi:isopenicillin-N epimerase